MSENRKRLSFEEWVNACNADDGSADKILDEFIKTPIPYYFSLICPELLKSNKLPSNYRNIQVMWRIDKLKDLALH